MTTVALNKKYRPQDFKNGFVGQEYTAKMIDNALTQGKLSNAILLSGERGGGKTTTARIIAKGLNCEQGPTSTPCGKCAYCTDQLMLINEIDAASNRGVEEVRNIKESLKYSTQEGKYKVYIIDEVHMMTKEAFNALLKTLEEPPSNVVFILCTTDPEKLPATIISRTQHFKFGKIPVEKIMSHLKEILEKEGITDFTTDALRVIAEHANGGMRDSLTLLEQCLLLNEELNAENVYKVIGTVDHTLYLKLLLGMNNNNFEYTLALAKDIIYKGVQPKYFYKDFLATITNVILRKIYTSHDKEIVSQLKNLNTNTLLQVSDILQRDMKEGFIELTMIKLFQIDSIKSLRKTDIKEVVSKKEETVSPQQPIVNESSATTEVPESKTEIQPKDNEIVHSLLAFKVFSALA